MLSTPGIGSGLDINGIIEQLMTFERRPLVALGTNQIELEAQLSGFGKLKSTVSLFGSALGELTSADKFKYFKATPSDDSVLKARAESNAGRGVYAIEVARTAENHRQAATAVFADTATSTIGVAGDTMTLTVGSAAFTVDIGGKTLAGVRDAINTAADNAGVTASILKDDAGYHLTLSANETGSDSLVTATYGAGDPLTGVHYADADTTTIGSAGRSMTITVDGNPFTVDYGGKTLNEIRDAINGAVDNTGVTAAVVSEPDGFRLELTPLLPLSTVATSFSPSDPFALQTLNLDRDTSGGFTAADLDAVLTLENTFTVTSSSNTISDAIEGVTLTLEKAGSLTLDVARDGAKIQGSAQQLIGVYNEVVKIMNELRGGVLAEERSSLVSLETQFRNLLNTKSGTGQSFSYFFELGASTKLDGTLSLDGAVFDSAVEADADGVADLFTNPDNGLAVRLKEFADQLIASGGLFDSREQSLNAQIRDVEDARARVEFRLLQRERSLVQQFSALDSLIATLNTTSSFLTTQLDQIAAITKSSNS